MSVTRDIFGAYRGFGASMRRQLAGNVGEERILAYGVIASLIVFIARTPGLIAASKSAAAAAEEDVTWVAIFSTNLVISFFFGLLMLYGIAALAHIIAKIFGGKGSFYSARLAFFWVLLVISPMTLVSTMIKTALPIPGVELTLTVTLTVLFFYGWITSLIVAEKPEKTP